MADPNLEVRPDFASNAFCEVQEALMDTLHIDVAHAIDHLVTAWNADHNHRVEDWNAQRKAEALEADHLQREEREREDEARRLEEAEAERERKEAEKKKPKIYDFIADLPPPNTIAPRPSQYALQKISSYNFVELWYFSLEGCSEAARNHRSQADDTLGFSNSNNILSLHPVASVRASCNACADHDLSFSEFLQAKNSFLRHIKWLAWPAKPIDALAEFFWNVENHGIHANENSDLIALHYASHIRRQWHDELKYNSDNIFNISIINDNFMNTVAFKINSNLQAKAA